MAGRLESALAACARRWESWSCGTRSICEHMVDLNPAVLHSLLVLVVM
jgi:hypothetical protein